MEIIEILPLFYIPCTLGCKFIIFIFKFFYRCDVFNSWQYPCFPVLFNTNGSPCSRNGRSHATCSSQAYITSREQMNALSAFIDGSQIYSSDSAMFTRLRSTGNGKFNLFPHYNQKVKNVGNCYHVY